MDLKGVSFGNASKGAAVGAYGTLLHTSDGGRTWIANATGKSDALLGVSFADATTAVAVGAQGIILRTTDGGATWMDQSIPPATSSVGFSTFYFFAVAMSRSGQGYIVGRWDTVWVVPGAPGAGFSRMATLSTTNGGASWSTTFISTPIAYSMLGVSIAGVNTAIAVGDSGLVERTTDGGRTWKFQTRFPPLTKSSSGTSNARVAFLSGVSFVNSDRGIAVGDGGVITRTLDAGQTWTDLPSGTIQRLNAIAMLDAQNGIIVGDSAIILRTSDGGDTWVRQNINVTSNLYSLAFLDATQGVVAGEGGTIMGSTQGGFPVFVENDIGDHVPSKFSLAQNYPNPFNPATAISYQLTAISQVSLKVFDVLGREVAILVPFQIRFLVF
jgi:photosystem II stability/assembly factor-like uncharacterized protein